MVNNNEVGGRTGTLSVSVNKVASVAPTLPQCTGLSFRFVTTCFVILLGRYGNTANYFQEV